LQIENSQMQQLNENFSVEQGSDPEVLLIVFSGFADFSVSQPFHFQQVAGLYPYSKIFVRDPTRRMCLHGIGGQLDSLEKLIDALRQTAQRLKATRIITVGSSGGSFPAILAAHLLKADYCHAFSPFPYANLERAILRMDWQIIRRFRRTVAKLNFLPTRTRKYYDLRKVLMDTNNHTRYFLHVCRHYRWDYKRAQYLAGLPNVMALGYPCDQHVVARYLAKQKCLDALFNINNQDKLLELEAMRTAVEIA
jgi:hypothetical protein